MTLPGFELSAPIEEGTLEEAFSDLDARNFLKRLYARDASIWSDDSREQSRIANRLGWLDAPLLAQEALPRIREKLSALNLAAFKDLLFLGMGGSNVFARVLESAPDLHGAKGLKLRCLDSLVPDQVSRSLELMAAPTTLIVVASKSGTTVETMTLANIAESRGAAHRTIALTDPGTPLEEHAREQGYCATFLSPLDVGGRFSPFTVFGLVPALLVGMDVEEMLDKTAAFHALCRNEGSTGDHPGAALGAAIGACAKTGTDILNLPSSGASGVLAPLIEQLIAESIGKQGQGIWPLSHVSGPALSLHERGPSGIGEEIYRWQIATAAMGAVLGVNPFDEPDVGLAKTLARQALDQLQTGGELPEPAPSRESLEDFCRKDAVPGEIMSLLLYLPVNQDSEARARRIANGLSQKFATPVMVGFGPRYLHTTGQLHKGGNDRARHLVITSDNETDILLSQGPMLSKLVLAQALADVQALQQKGRSVTHLHLKTPAFEALSKLEEMLSASA